MKKNGWQKEKLVFEEQRETRNKSKYWKNLLCTTNLSVVMNWKEHINTCKKKKKKKKMNFIKKKKKENGKKMKEMKGRLPAASFSFQSKSENGLNPGSCNA